MTLDVRRQLGFDVVELLADGANQLLNALARRAMAGRLALLLGVGQRLDEVLALGVRGDYRRKLPSTRASIASVLAR